ncbi:hypothetical protein BDK51DRAFT_51761, partial [Blyttiomyces helicus]
RSLPAHPPHPHSATTRGPPPSFGNAAQTVRKAKSSTSLREAAARPWLAGFAADPTRRDPQPRRGRTVEAVEEEVEVEVDQEEEENDAADVEDNCSESGASPRGLKKFLSVGSLKSKVRPSIMNQRIWAPPAQTVVPPRHPVEPPALPVSPPRLATSPSSRPLPSPESEVHLITSAPDEDHSPSHFPIARAREHPDAFDEEATEEDALLIEEHFSVETVDSYLDRRRGAGPLVMRTPPPRMSPPYPELDGRSDPEENDADFTNPVSDEGDEDDLADGDDQATKLSPIGSCRYSSDHSVGAESLHRLSSQSSGPRSPSPFPQHHHESMPPDGSPSRISPTRPHHTSMQPQTSSIERFPSPNEPYRPTHLSLSPQYTLPTIAPPPSTLALESDLTATREALATTRRDLDSTRTDHAVLRATVTAIERRAETAESARERLEAEVDSWRRACAALEARVAETDAMRREMDAVVREIDDKARAHAEELVRQVEELRAQLAAARHDYADTRAQLFDARDSQQGTLNEMKGLSEALAQMSLEKSDLEDAMHEEKARAYKAETDFRLFSRKIKMQRDLNESVRGPGRE